MYQQVNRNAHPSDPLLIERKHQFIEKFNQDKIQYQIKLFNGLTCEKDKWNFINEARNTRRSNVQIHSLRNCFGDIVTDDLRMANLLNYRSSKLGDYSGVVKKFISSEHLINDEFQFQPISIYECRKQIKSLNINEPLGPSNIPAWALKDASDVLAEPLTFLINAFLEGLFPNHLKQACHTNLQQAGNSTSRRHI